MDRLSIMVTGSSARANRDFLKRKFLTTAVPESKDTSKFSVSIPSKISTVSVHRM
jgi:hypothetical protein